MNARKIASVLPGLSIVVVLLFVPLLPPANAVSLITCTATLSASDEAPPNASPATGSGTFTFDPSTSTTTYVLTYSGLVATVTAAHIHAPAPPGVNAPVRVPIPGLTGTSGSVSGSTTTLLGMTPAQFAGNLTAGLAYVNIHSSTYPGGEIRGQLNCGQSVPEFNLPPFLLAALLLPAALVLALRRQRSRK